MKEDVVMYRKVSADMNFVEREKQTEKFWEEHEIFEKSMKQREGNQSYVFYDGRRPPTASRISAMWRPA